MATITTTGNLTQPDVTTPVSPAALRGGITGNINGGTASSNNVGNASSAVILGGAGSSNANVGGVVYRGAGQSSNQFPVSEATLQPGAPTGGAGQSYAASDGSSTNPASIQEDVTSRIATEKVAQTTLANISSPAGGELINFPKTTETASFGSSSSIASNVTLNNQQNANAYVGITENKTFVVDELTRLAAMRTDVINSGEDEKVDGAAQGANSEDKFQSVNGENLMTPSVTVLPGGVPQSQLIGPEALVNDFPASSGTTTPGSY